MDYVRKDGILDRNTTLPTVANVSGEKVKNISRTKIKIVPNLKFAPCILILCFLLGEVIGISLKH